MKIGIDSWGFETASPVLRDITFEVEPGEAIAVLGPSGIGKSTLLHLIAGLLPGGDEVVSETQGRLAMVFQEPTLAPWASVAQNLRLVVEGELTDAEVNRHLESVGLEGLSARLAGRLSLGQQRRVSLARALCLDPAVVILDEPFASLDRALARELVGLVRDLREARSISLVLATHDPAEALAVCDRLILLGGKPASLDRCLDNPLTRDQRKDAQEVARAVEDLAL